ncbi:hypothetical protein D3C74_146060 [compost metagenome]
MVRLSAGNSNAVTHGFFRKFLPDDTAAIMEAIETRSPIEMLWDQIKLAYAAILRAQQTMDVTDKDEIIKELKKQKFEIVEQGKGDALKSVPVPVEVEYEFQFAWIGRQCSLMPRVGSCLSYAALSSSTRKCAVKTM